MQPYQLYGISGLGADQRVFEFLRLNCELIPIDWIPPRKGEPIQHYAMRLSEAIDPTRPFGLIGVSFGGLIATEISKKLKPTLTILISSAETCNELRWLYRILGKTKVMSILPTVILRPQIEVAAFLFGTKKKVLLSEILNDTNLDFAKWAIQELLSWSNEEHVENCLKISGTKGHF